MRFPFLLSLVAGPIAIALYIQRDSGAGLRAEYAMLSARTADLAQTQEQNRRLSGAAISAAELERLRSDHAAMARLQSEIAALQNALPPVPTAALARKAEQDWLQALTQDERTQISRESSNISKEQKSRDTWRDAGKATAGAALETVFWSAAEGDLGTLSSAIGFDPSVRAHAEPLVAELPATLREQYDTPEKLFARSFASHIGQVTSLQVASSSGSPGTAPSPTPPYVTVRAVLQTTTAGGETGAIMPPIEFELRYHSDGWHLVVPYAAIEEYTRLVSEGRSPLL